MKNLLVRGLGLVSLFSVVAVSLVASTSLVGCAEEEAPAAQGEADSGEDDLKNTEKNGKKSSQWIRPAASRRATRGAA